MQSAVRHTSYLLSVLPQRQLLAGKDGTEAVRLHLRLPVCKYHMEGLATTFVKFSEIEKVFDNIVHPDPAVKKTVILFDGAED